MKTGIKVSCYRHINDEIVNCVYIKSYYNYNFYINNQNDIILEICDDNFQYDYYRSVIENNQLIDKFAFLGTHFGESIFDKNFNYILDDDGYAIVDDTIF